MDTVYVVEWTNIAYHSRDSQWRDKEFTSLQDAEAEILWQVAAGNAVRMYIKE